VWATSRPLGLFLEQQAQEGLSGILLKSESRTERQAQGEPSVLIRILALIAHDRPGIRLSEIRNYPKVNQDKEYCCSTN